MKAARKSGLTVADGITVDMPRTYVEHVLCKQMRVLMDEDILRDTEVAFMVSGSRIKISAFLLSLVSPVFHKMVCGAFRESLNRELQLHDAQKSSFQKILDLAIGRDGVSIDGFGELLELASLADRFQMFDVVAALEDVVLNLLTVDACADVLSASTAAGLVKIEEAGRTLALSKFEEMAALENFVNVKEETLAIILDDDRLVAQNEEIVFGALIKWMQGGDKQLRGQSLLQKIRFPLMDGKFLALHARTAMQGVESAEGLLMEAMLMKHVPPDERHKIELRHLGARAMVPRIGKGVAWERYSDGGEMRLSEQSQTVLSLADCGGKICIGSKEGIIRVLNKATLQDERALEADGGGDVWSLTAWDGWLISGHSNGRVRVWDLSSGLCERVLKGHTRRVRALAVAGSRLISGSEDRTIKIWAMGTAVSWPCERTLSGHSSWVAALATWQERVISGSEDNTIRVWSVTTGTAEASIDVHTNSVTALAVRHPNLISASKDGTVRVWALGTWQLLRTVQAYRMDSNQFAYRLAVSGGWLISGSVDVSGQADEGRQYEVRVWDLETFASPLALPQPHGSEIYCLLAVDGGQVLAGVGTEVVIWGR